MEKSFYKAVQPGCIGHGKSFMEAAMPAAAHGFEGYWFSIENDSKVSAEETLEMMSRSGLRAAGFNLPMEFRREEEAFQKGMETLDAYAAYAAKIGADRCITWILPSSKELNYADNFALHRDRLAKAAKVLGEHGIRLGLEFVGPPSAWRNAKYEFIHNLDQVLELCHAIGTGNMGVLLDVWHWDLAGQTRQDFTKLTGADQVVLVHINDAPEGIAAEDQKDNKRGLPGATGVLKIADFFDGLKSLGYDGPVVAEPFDDTLKDMSFDRALDTVMAAMKKVWPET